MGLGETSNFSIFTFSSASDLKVCMRSYSNCFYLVMRFKGLNGKVCKMMTSHFGTLWTPQLPLIYSPNLLTSITSIPLSYL